MNRLELKGGRMLLKQGKVYFVGAGPGDPELITMKGIYALAEADVIIYDRLIPIQLLKYTKPGARLCYCGKEPGDHAKTQSEIHALMLSEAKQGRVVVRLKGGDPGIFGRVGEEAAICAEHQIPIEVIPGITSGLAAASYAGIPLTHREYSSNVAFISGHRSEDNEKKPVNWAAIAGFDTIVVYMGVKQLPMIREQLLKHGKDPHTPVAVVRSAATGHQQTSTGTLDDLTAIAQKMQLRAPAVIIIGAVVSARSWMNWFERKLLFGRKVLLFGGAQSAQMERWLNAQGAETIDVQLSFVSDSMPMISTVHAHAWNIFAEYMKEWERGRGFNVLWISGEEGLHALQHASLSNEEWKANLRSIPDVICEGEQTAKLAEEWGWNVGLIIPQGSSPKPWIDEWIFRKHSNVSYRLS